MNNNSKPTPKDMAEEARSIKKWLIDGCIKWCLAGKPIIESGTAPQDTSGRRP